MSNVIEVFPVAGGAEKPSSGERRKQPIRQAVKYALTAYLAELNGHSPSALYEFVISEVEHPLLAVVLEYTNGNVSKAAQILGLTRGTLRKKLKQHGLN